MQQLPLFLQVTKPKLFGKEVSISLFNMKGEKKRFYSGIADNLRHTAQLQVSDVPSGEYYYYLQCGGWNLRKTITIIH